MKEDSHGGQEDAAQQQAVGAEDQAAQGEVTGAALLRGRVLPKVLRVRLMLDAGGRKDAAEMAGLRHKAYAWLLCPEGGELAVLGDPGMTYRDAVCTDASGWPSLFEDGACEIEFTCYDPYGYGGRGFERGRCGRGRRDGGDVADDCADGRCGVGGQGDGDGLGAVRA